MSAANKSLIEYVLDDSNEDTAENDSDVFLLDHLLPVKLVVLTSKTNTYYINMTL